jgi:hypothetical protein
MKTDIKPWLGIITFIGFIACLGLLFSVPPPSGTRDIILVVIGTLVVLVKDVYAFYFGSSEGSARKTELMSGTDLPLTPLVQGTASTPQAPEVKEGGFVRPLILFILSILLIIGLSGCATTTTQDMATAAIAGKQAIITAAAGTDAGCRTSLIPPDDCALALASYQASQIVTVTALQGLLANATDEAIRAQLQQAIDAGFPPFTFAP